jgi:uncharacterized repeat protein (TIGR02543 family)
VTLSATPAAGYIFDGWSGACSGNSSTCTLTPSGDTGISATFTAPPHRRILTLRLRAHRATGALSVVDGYEPCRMSVAVIIERRGKHGWSIMRGVRTDDAGLFAVSIPSGRAIYRANAPGTTANGQECVKTVSRTLATSA